eukprot:m.175620 g.175620  ORF g.175620 m.175620 type:complete len:228 (+) comp13518_c3_seq13:714-1397(+)
MSSDDNYDDDTGFDHVGMDDDIAPVVPAPKVRKARKPRRKKDPNKPKGALTPYMCFSKSVRPAIMKDNPTAKVTIVAKMIGQKWRQLTDEEKAPYNDLARQDRERYKRDMETYVPTPGYEDSGKRRRRKKKDPNAPKKPRSAYFIFAGDRREDIKSQNPDMRVAEIAKKTGAEWRNLSDDQKKPYFDKAAILKQEYNEAVETYKLSIAPPDEHDEEEDEDDDDDDME